MIRNARSNLWILSGLSKRFQPKSRIGQGLIAVGPWIDILLLLVLFSFLDARLVLQPGVVVELPDAPFFGGTRLGMNMVLMSVSGGRGHDRSEIVFFDDERFVVGDEEHMRHLGTVLSAKAQGRGGESLVIQADRRVRHGTIVDIMNKALASGVAEVNLAAREE